eukprot:14429133-Alexandrium_andersonii.AAC.1
MCIRDRAWAPTRGLQGVAAPPSGRGQMWDPGLGLLADLGTSAAKGKRGGRCRVGTSKSAQICC